MQNWGHIFVENGLGYGLNVLDLGCGAFDHWPFFDKSKSYLGIDIDFEILRIAKGKHKNVAAICGDGAVLPFRSDSFDAVISVFNLEHIVNLANCIRELKRVIRPEGVLAATLPTEGVLFRVGRRLTSARFAVRELGFKSAKEYEKYVASSHVNSLEVILDALKEHFRLEKVRYFPFGVGGKHININLGIRAVPL